MSEEIKKTHFKELAYTYLIKYSLNDLRSYGRFLNLPTPTKFKKLDLINEILSVLCKDKFPTRTKRGAPLKNNYFQEEIPKKIEELQKLCFDDHTAEPKNSKSHTDIEQINLTINLYTLNERQKKLLKAFINSL